MGRSPGRESSRSTHLPAWQTTAQCLAAKCAIDTFNGKGQIKRVHDGLLCGMISQRESDGGREKRPFPDYANPT